MTLSRFFPPALVILASFSALASSFHAEPLADAVRATDSIVRGKINRSESRWDVLPDGTRHLFTYYDIEVSEAFKGESRPNGGLQFRELGGDKDGYSMKVSGAAGFSPGEDVVLMLNALAGRSSDAYVLRGMMMGKFNIERDDDGTEYLVGPGIGSERHPAERHSHESSRVSLEEFRTLIKTQAATPNPSVTTVPVSQPSGVSAHSHVHDGSDQDSYREAGLLKDSSERTQRFHPAILLLGAMIGAGMWFLKSRKKRR